MISLKDVTQDQHKVESLHVGLDDFDLCTPEKIAEFPSLKELSFHVNLGNSTWADFPKAFLSTEIEQLNILGVRVSQFSELKLKKLKAVIHALEFPLVIKHFPNIEELDLTIDGDIKIDSSFLKLSHLNKLSLRFISGNKIEFDVADLSSLQKLTTLQLAKVSNSEFSSVWCSLDNLESLCLNNFDNFKDFPKQIENLQNLHHLNLSYVGTSGKDWNSDDFFEDEEAIAMPLNFSLLKNLHTFSSSQCAYGDFEALKALSQLKEISINGSELKSIPDLIALTNLETLDLEHAYDITNINGLKDVTSLKNLNLDSVRISDISPLNELLNLQNLNLSGTRFDKNKFSVISALSHLSCFKTLKTLNLKSISQDEWQALDKDSFLNVMNKDEILSICKNVKQSDSNLFEKACLNILDLEDVFENQIDKRADDGGRDTIDFFDAALKQHISNFEESTLIHLIKISFVETNLMDSYELTIIVLEEAIKRQSVAVQEAMSVAFIKGHEYYDAGHRFFGTTVYDTLVDELFEQFEEAPLATMLLGTDKQLLSSVDHYGDGLGELFYSYFKKTSDQAKAEQVLLKYKAHIFEDLTDIEDESEIEQLLTHLNNPKNSPLINQQLSEISTHLSTFYKAYTAQELGPISHLLTELNQKENTALLKYIDWDSVIDDNPCDFTDLDFDLCYSLFLICHKASKDVSGEQLFFILLFQIDADKLHTKLAEEFNDSKIIKDIGYYNSFDVSHEDFDLFKAIVIGEINGIDADTVKREEAERLAIQKEKQQKNKIKKEIKSSLQAMFTAAMNDEDEIENFVTLSTEHATNTSDIKSLDYDFANYTTKLIIQYLQQGQFEEPIQIFNNYMDNLLPKVGFHDKSYDVASNALVLGILSKDEAICKKVFGELLGKDFIIQDNTNEMLLFNLSCYYAINKDKDSLIPAVKQAIKLGKPAQQFLSDNDFADFHEDEDFLAVLEG